MFDLLSFPQIINHLKQISPNMYRTKGNEIMIHCPFCNDAQRKNAQSHGHLYLSIKSPVFHCFRCNASGILISLLSETNFHDRETINELRSYVKFKFSKDYYRKTQPKEQISQIISQVRQKKHEFREQYPIDYNRFVNYIKCRLGNIIDPSIFLIYPDYAYNRNGEQLLSVYFLNSDNILSCIRYIDNNENFRYKRLHGYYYFQDKQFDKINQIVIGEGPFDVLNSYLYLIQFNDAFFISINSNHYIGECESIIINHCLVGEFEINIIFDQTINYTKQQYKIRKLSYLNKNIKFRFWKPSVSKDIGEYPEIMEIV